MNNCYELFVVVCFQQTMKLLYTFTVYVVHKILQCTTVCFWQIRKHTGKVLAYTFNVHARAHKKIIVL